MRKYNMCRYEADTGENLSAESRGKIDRIYAGLSKKETKFLQKVQDAYVWIGFLNPLTRDDERVLDEIGDERQRENRRRELILNIREDYMKNYFRIRREMEDGILKKGVIDIHKDYEYRKSKIREDREVFDIDISERARYLILRSVIVRDRVAVDRGNYKGGMRRKTGLLTRLGVRFSGFGNDRIDIFGGSNEGKR